MTPNAKSFESRPTVCRFGFVLSRFSGSIAWGTARRRVSFFYRNKIELRDAIPNDRSTATIRSRARL
jgi:hypothetical protein